MRTVRVITRYCVVIEESLADAGGDSDTHFIERRFNKGKSPSGLDFPKELALSTEFEDAELATRLAKQANRYYKDLITSGKWMHFPGSATLHPVTTTKKK